MRRRSALHAVGTSGLLALAGCAGLGSPTELHSPERTDDEQETYWTFHRDGDRLTTVGVEYADRYPSGLVPLRFHTWHHESTHLEGFRLEFRFGRHAGTVPPDVLLDTFDSHPDPTLEFTDHPDRGATSLTVADLGPVGRGSLRVDFLVRPHDWLPGELGVRIEQTLSTNTLLDATYRTVVDDRIPFDVGSP